MNNFAFDFSHTPALSCFMNSGVVQISINNLLRTPRSSRLACRHHRDQRVKQLSQHGAIMGQFIRDKQGLVLAARSQVLQHLPGIVKTSSPNPEGNQQSRGGVDSCPDPRLPVLTLNVFGATRTFLFFTKDHSSSSCTSVSFNEVRSPESTLPQCSPARRITRLTVSLSISKRRAVARTPTPSAAWWMICRIDSSDRCNPNRALA